MAKPPPLRHGTCARPPDGTTPRATQIISVRWALLVRTPRSE